MTATFRGFAHLEKHWAGKKLVHLEPLDQWNVVRKGRLGDWKLNPKSQSTNFDALPAANTIPAENWLIRTVHRHIDWIGLVKFIRGNLCEKDWDAFCETYDVPGAVVIGPPNVQPSKETEYKEAAQSVAEGGSGYLPNGSAVNFSTPPTGEPPFKVRLENLRQQMVLVGTGGLLTMITAPTGIGKGPSEEHARVFKSIARAEARKISEGVFQKQFDKPTLEGFFPGKPILAYWELAAREASDVGEIVEHAAKLSSAGFSVDAATLSERTGFKLRLRGKPNTLTALFPGKPRLAFLSPPVRPATDPGADSNRLAFNEGLANRISLQKTDTPLQSDEKPLTPISR